MNPYLHFSLDLLAAALLGGLIGVQRQATQKPAGLRTHVLVAIGACAFMETSRLVGDSRIAAGVITGVGFLGAGAIVRRGVTPHGLTTAASIWSAAAVGLALGLGSAQAQTLAVVTAVITLVTLSMSDAWVHEIFPGRAEIEVSVTFDAAKSTAKAIHDVLALVGRTNYAAPLKMEREGDALIATVSYKLRAKHKHDWPGTLRRLLDVDGVRDATMAAETETL
jgi:putative Mg2+ transporter-C (MgtC) family protein